MNHRTWAVGVALSTLAILTGCGASDDPGTPPSAASSSSTPAAAASGETDADGFPAGFTYPPGATVEITAPQHSLYTLAATDVAAVEEYWGPHLTSLGFELASQAEGAGTYQRGTMTVQVTWGQAGDEVRGAANVLTP